MRSRPRHDCAYSPTGAGGVASRRAGAGRPASGRRRCRSRRRRSAPPGSARRRAPARSVFIAQVRPGLPLAPNLWPAAKTTFGASGSAAMAARSSRSQAIVSMPCRGEPVAHRRLAEAGDADDAPRRRRALAPGERASAPSCRRRRGSSGRLRRVASSSTRAGSAASGSRRALRSMRSARARPRGRERSRSGHGRRRQFSGALAAARGRAMPRLMGTPGRGASRRVAVEQVRQARTSARIKRPRLGKRHARALSG